MLSIYIRSVQMSLPEYCLTAFRFLLKTQVRKKLWLLALVALVLGSTLYRLLVGGTTLDELWQQEAALVVFSGFLLLFPLLFLGLLRWQYYRSPFPRSVVSYELSTASVRVEGAAFQATLPWSSIQQAYVFGNWLFLQISPQSGYYVDLRRVQPPAAAADVLALLQQVGHPAV